MSKIRAEIHEVNAPNNWSVIVHYLDKCAHFECGDDKQLALEIYSRLNYNIFGTDEETKAK